MRIKVDLLSNFSFRFPKGYRNYFISFLKQIFIKAGISSNLYENKKSKPFVFSAWLGEEFEIEKDDIKLGEKISFLFSTGDPFILTSFYNGLISIKEQNEKVHLGETNLKIENIFLQPLKKIKGEKVLFKTIGISVLTNPGVPAKDFKKWHILPSDDLNLFNNVLKKRTNKRYEYIKGEKRDFEISLRPLTEEEFFMFRYLYKQNKNLKSSLNETIVKHYGAYLRGFRGIFWLEGDEEILQFTYDYGLGVRTGQGFGMLEVLGTGGDYGRR